MSKRLLDADLTGKELTNYVKDEVLTVERNSPQNLAHDIFFEDGFVVSLNAGGGGLLYKGVDYEFTNEDTIATELSNKNCWKQIIVRKNVSKVYISYQAYGDFVSADTINQMYDSIDGIKETGGMTSTQVAELDTKVTSHIIDTAPHEATSEPTASRIAMRTDKGTLKANTPDGTVDNELTTVGYVESIKTELENADTNLNTHIENNFDILQAFAQNIGVDQFDPDPAAFPDPAAQEWIDEQERLAKEHVNATPAYHTAIRNEHGSLAVPEAVNATEAVNKAQLDTAIETLVGTAPETLDTLEEIAKSLKGDANAVDTLIGKINQVKTEAETDATTKANTAKTEAISTANTYTDNQLVNYYTQTETDTAINNAKTQAEITAAEKAEEAESNAKEHTNTALENYYNKNETYKKSEVDEKLGKIPTSGGGLIYDFDIVTGYETNDTVFIDGKRKPVIRLCIQKENVTNNFYINTKEIGSIEHIMKISGTVTGTNGYILSAENAVSCYVDRDNEILWFVFEKQGVKYNTALIIDFITEYIS